MIVPVILAMVCLLMLGFTLTLAYIAPLWPLSLVCIAFAGIFIALGVLCVGMFEDEWRTRARRQ